MGDVRDLTSFFDAVLRYEIGLWEVLDGALQSAHDVSLGRLQALRVVGERGGTARVQDVANDLSVTVGAASKLVDRLERDGTALRSPNPDDRRSSLISLTPSGARLVAEGRATVEAVLAQCLPAAALADADLASLTATLRRLNDHLASVSRQEVEV